MESVFQEVRSVVKSSGVSPTFLYESGSPFSPLFTKSGRLGSCSQKSTVAPTNVASPHGLMTNSPIVKALYVHSPRRNAGIGSAKEAHSARVYLFQSI